MNQVYRAMGISKQGFHQHLDRYLEMLEEQEQLMPVIDEIRRDHPQMSARIMYGLNRCRWAGIDLSSFAFRAG